MRAAEGSCQGEMFIHVWINNDSLCCGQSQESDLIYYTEYKQSFSLLFQYLGQVNMEGKWTLQRDQGLLKKKKKERERETRRFAKHTAVLINTGQTFRLIRSVTSFPWRWGWPLFQRVCDRVESNGGIKVLPPYFYQLRVFKPLQKRKKKKKKSTNLCHPLFAFHTDGELKPIWKRESRQMPKESHQKFAEKQGADKKK